MDGVASGFFVFSADADMETGLLFLLIDFDFFKTVIGEGW